ncbi:hypothetical protein D3C80_2184290 [compost metagenome]
MRVKTGLYHHALFAHGIGAVFQGMFIANTFDSYVTADIAFSCRTHHLANIL